MSAYRTKRLDPYAGFPLSMMLLAFGCFNDDPDAGGMEGTETSGTTDTETGASTSTSTSLSGTDSETSTGGTGSTAGSDTTSIDPETDTGIDTEPPTILSVEPSDGQTGVAADANLVVTFSEPMNKGVAQSAYQSADIPPSAAVLTWNTAGDVLTINPNADLVYAEGTDVSMVVAQSYSFLITTVAEDLAGNPLASDEMVTFSTLRRISTELTADAVLTHYIRADGDTTGCSPYVCAGDSGIANNAQYKGLLTFDIASLPRRTSSIESAAISAAQTNGLGTPYVDLGDLNIEHFLYADVGIAAFNNAPLQSLGLFSNSTAAVMGVDVTVAAQEDLEKRVERGDRSQYRLVFDKVSDFDNAGDQAYFGKAGIKMALTYLVP